MTHITNIALAPRAEQSRARMSTKSADLLRQIRARAGASRAKPPPIRALAAELSDTTEPRQGAPWRTLTTAQRRRLVAVEMAGGASNRGAASGIARHHRGCTVGAVFGIVRRWRAELRERGFPAPTATTIVQIGRAIA